MNLENLLALAQGKRNEIAARSTFSNITKIPKLKSRWRILPGWDATAGERFFHDFGQHYIKDADGNVVVVYVCEMDTFGRECSICDRLNDMIRATKDDKTLDQLKGMKSRQIQLVNAVRLDGAEADPKKPVLLGLPSSAMSDYLGVLADYQIAHGINILSPTEGRDITIDRQGDGLNTKYRVMPAPTSSAVAPEALERLIDIALFAEGEFQKGVRKGTDLLEKTTRTLVGVSSGSALVPSRAGLVAPSRTIEADEVPWERPAVGAPATVSAVVTNATVGAVIAEPVVTITEEEVLAAEAAPLPAAKPVVAAVTTPVKVETPADGAPLGDEELARILAELDA